MPISTKHKAFRRIGEKRTNKTLDEIRKLGNLSSNNYEFSEAEVSKIFSTIRGAIDTTEAQFNRRIKRDHFTM